MTKEMRTEKVKDLLIKLEKELRFFRDGSREDRDCFRKLSVYDIGYISSLLTMLCEEDKFKRWVVFTTNKFRSFERRIK